MNTCLKLSISEFSLLLKVEHMMVYFKRRVENEEAKSRVPFMSDESVCLSGTPRGGFDSYDIHMAQKHLPHFSLHQTTATKNISSFHSSPFAITSLSVKNKEEKIRMYDKFWDTE